MNILTNVQAFLAIAKVVLGIVPELLRVISAIEDQFQQQGAGSAKLGMVKEFMRSIYEGFGKLDIAFETLWPTIERIVTVVVGTYNTLGWNKPEDKTQ